MPLEFSAPRAARVAGIVACAALAVAGHAAAEVHPFGFVSGSTVRAVREEQDIFLNPLEVKDWDQAWQAGLGLHIHSSAGDRVGDQPRWETRLRLGYGSGELADVRIQFARSSAPLYSWTSVERFDYTSLTLGAAVLARLHPHLGVFLGPTLERVSFRGDLDRSWEGPIPDYCAGSTSCGERHADAEGSAIYGSIEVGTRIESPFRAVAAEFYWIPRRVQMSTTQTVDEDQYKAEFAELDSSWGLRLTYDF